MEPADWRNIVGVHLERRRHALDMSKRAAARAAGVSEIIWRQLESGQRQVAPGIFVTPNPEKRTQLGVARALEWPDDWLAKLTAGDTDSIERILVGGRPQLVDDADAGDRFDRVLEELAEIRRRLDALENPGRPGRASVTPLPTGRRAAQESRYRKGDDGPPDGQDES